MAATLSVVSLLVDQGLVLGQTGLPVEQEQRSVEAEPEVVHVKLPLFKTQGPLIRTSREVAGKWQVGGTWRK